MSAAPAARPAPPRLRLLAGGLGAVAAAEVVAAGVLTVAVGWSWQAALDSFVLTNSLMGAAFAVCGAIIAWHRPDNAIGWLMVAAGIGHATTAFCAPLGQALLDSGASTRALRLVVTVFIWSWPWSIGLFLPLVLLLFPDGHPPSPRWRPVVVAVVVTAPLFVVAQATYPEPVDESMPVGYLTLPSYDALAPLWTAAEARTAAALGLAVVALLVRYRRAGDAQRRQLLWLVLAAITAFGALIPWAFVGGTPVVVLFAIPLIPVAVTVAILRHQLLDIRLAVSRAVAFVLLSVAVLAGYVALVAVLDQAVVARVGRSAVATVIIALLVAPVLPRLQRLVDRAMYGDRGDPARVASRVGQRLTAGAGGLASVAAALREGLRMRYVAVSTPAGILGAAGEPGDGPVCSLPLEYQGEPVGELLVGLRPGERELASRDRDVLALVAAPLAVAVHATGLSTQLQASRGRIVAAREEERRRLRRDLHDELGPTLTGVALAADAATNLVDRDPDRTTELLTSIRGDVRTALADVRRLVDDLRPPALDELGLVGALRQRTEQIPWRADGAAVRVRLDVPADVPVLPAAVEVAAYRIANEALTNVVRHAQAPTAVLRLRFAETLELEVVDDGPPANGGWRPGVGLQGMRERASELGGRFEAGPTPAGGRVFVSLPLATPWASEPSHAPGSAQPSSPRSEART